METLFEASRRGIEAHGDHHRHVHHAVLLGPP
jgi:hypothetical protein